MSLVSVIIPAYNQSQYLAAAVLSVLDQTYQDFEIIVVDDGSTDDTRQVVDGIKERRLHYIYQENAGLSAARNTGIRNSIGKYLTYLDSDDLFTPHKLELLLAKLENEPNLGFVAGQAVLIDERGILLGKTFDRPPPSELSDLIYWNPFHVSSVMVRRSWQERVGFFDEGLRAYEDWDMWLRLARFGCAMGWIAEPVSNYRFHTGQMTRDRERMTTATFAVLSKLFADPELPLEWKAKKDQAYSNAYLRAAIQSYRSGAFSEAQTELTQAIQLNPELAVQRGRLLAQRFSAMADLPKAQDKFAFLEMIYDHLPLDLEALGRDRNQHLAETAVELGFEAYQEGKLPRAQALFRRAIRLAPRWILNRGILSILLKRGIPADNNTY